MKTGEIVVLSTPRGYRTTPPFLYTTELASLLSAKMKKVKKHPSQELASFNQCLNISQLCNDEKELYFKNNKKANYFGTVTIKNTSTRCCLEIFITDCEGCHSSSVLPGKSFVYVVKNLKCINVTAIATECNSCDDVATGDIILQLHYCIKTC